MSKLIDCMSLKFDSQISTIQSIDTLSVIGRGNWGYVNLISKSGQFAVMKSYEKRHVHQPEQKKRILKENEIHKKLIHQFVVQWLYATENSHYVFIMMEFAPGGYTV